MGERDRMIWSCHRIGTHHRTTPQRKRRGGHEQAEGGEAQTQKSRKMRQLLRNFVE
jgi:hypothetical protein